MTLLFNTPSRFGRGRFGATRLGSGGALPAPVPPPPPPTVTLPIFEDFERGSVTSASISVVPSAFSPSLPSSSPALGNTSFSDIIAGGSVADFDPTHTASGTLGLKVALGGTGGQWRGGWRVGGPEFWGRAYHYVASPGPGSDTALLQVGGAPNMAMAAIVLRPDMFVELRDRSGAPTASSRAVPLDLLVRYEWHFLHAGASGFGEVLVWFSPQSSGAPTFRMQAAGDFGTETDVSEYWLGVRA